jgi:K+-sensing histidine kinase KdpD
VKQTSARSFIGSPVFDVSGEAFGIIGVLSDTAMEELPNSRYMLSILSSRAASEIQRIRSKELLRQQTRELAEINLMKDKLISVITTDLHAPLNTQFWGIPICSRINHAIIQQPKWQPK